MDSGRRIGPYELLSEVGRGASGVVYLAKRADAQRTVALKVLQERDAEDVVRFVSEIEIARKLDHPGIVRLIDAGQVGKQLYCALEFCPGPTLKQRLRQGALEPYEAAALVRDLALAMEHAHQRGVVHRDLKPANVILDARTGEPRVTDFGLARGDSVMRLTQSNQLIGTPHYMAPEQIRDSKHADARADVYGLGAILYHCLSGQTPYAAETVTELLVQKRETDPLRLDRFDPSLPPALVSICARALARHPAERFAAAAELAAALDGALPQGGQSQQPPLRRGRLLGLVGLGLAAASGLALAAAWPRRPAFPAQPPASAVEAPAGADAQVATASPRPERDSEDPAWLVEVEQLIEAGNYAEAEVLLDEAVERGRGARVLLAQDPDAVDLDLLNALRFRGTVRRELGDDEAALTDQTRAIELYPGMSRLYEERAMTYWLLERDEAARADYDTALELDPDSLVATLSRALFLNDTGDTSGAERDLTRALELEPGLITAWFERARIRHGRGSLELAEADYDRLLELDPDSAEGLAWRGQLYVDTARHEQAAADWERALEVWPGGTDGREGIQESLQNLRQYLSQR